MTFRLRQLGPMHRQGKQIGLLSICSSHPAVLRTAMSMAGESGCELLIEATCNQVNPFGGYTGMTPAGFMDYVTGLAAETGFPSHKLIIGGDHLGPWICRNEPADSAMKKACDLVSRCVQAGYRKIHLDAGMPLADDAGRTIPMELSARRTAVLCAAAEKARTKSQRKQEMPTYVIGAEAPTPGGSLENADHVPVTSPENVSEFLMICRKFLMQYGIEDAWQRVTAIVVQPGIDFGQTEAAVYDRNRARDLSMFHDHLPGDMTYEIHGTDFQPPMSLAQMVEDHFPLLKTGPALTFAYREAIFSLAGIESEWLAKDKTVRLSRIRRVIKEQMLQNPGFWKSHCPEADEKKGWIREFGYHDRIRYYWRTPEIEEALGLLFENLGLEIPLPLISQYFPDAYQAVSSGNYPGDIAALIQFRIRAALDPYFSACNMSREQVKKNNLL